MKKFLNISAEPASPGSGGGWDEDPRHPKQAAQSHGFVALAFGTALGLTLGIFYYLLGALEQTRPLLADLWSSGEGADLKNFLAFLCIFVTGLIFGTFLSALYNVLLFKHFNLFGDERKIC